MNPTYPCRRYSVIKPFLRLAAFLLCFALLVLAANFTLVKTDSVVAMTLREMRQAQDIQLAVVGSSVVRDHFNQALISEQTGLSSYSIAIPGAGFQTFTAITEELYKTANPQIIVLVIEPYNFNTVREDPEPVYKSLPWLTGLGTRLRYYMAASRSDGGWLDRALLFRSFPAEGLSDVAKTLGMRFAPEATFAAQGVLFDEAQTHYAGRGFLRHEGTPDLGDTIRREMLAEYDVGYDYPLIPGTCEMLLAYRDLVARHGSRLIVLFSDNHTSHALAEPDFLRYMDNAMRFLAENDIEAYNLFYAKEDFLPNLDSTYYDLYHMNGTGADIQSAAFARLMNTLLSGEDVSDWFYQKAWEYRETVTWVVNTWVHPSEGDHFTAACNTGSIVTPQYRFVLRQQDGQERLLRDYSEEPTIHCPLGEGESLRVWARLKEYPDHPPVYYDYPDDYAYAAAHDALYLP